MQLESLVKEFLFECDIREYLEAVRDEQVLTSARSTGVLAHL